MKKQLIATIVGGIILFVWQFLSWSLLNIHAAEYQYTPNQDKIIEFLSQNLNADGGYMIPQAAPGSTDEERQAVMENAMGKPWATINYHKSMDMSMSMNMIRGFAVDLVAAFLLVWLLLRFAHLDFKTTFMAALAVGFTGYLTIPYLNSVWFEASSIGSLIDTVAQWGLLGVWLGWWLNRP